MKNILLLLLLIFFVVDSFAQQMPAFKLVRYDDDYSFLKKDTSKNDWYKKTKFQPLSKNRDAYVSFGGDVRYQYFYFKNEGWGTQPKDNDGYIFSRYLIHADFHAGKYFRTYVQLQSSLANGKINSSPVDENQLDLHQAFFDVVLPVAEKKNLTIRIGRQEFLYGTQRIISVREGPNNRNAFDAAKLFYTSRNFRADAFFSHYVLSKRNIFDDGFNKNTKFWGGYAVINRIPIVANADLYYLGLWKQSVAYDAGTARELRHSVGTRVWKRNNYWQYDFEALYQWGKFGTGNITAWTLSSNTTYTFASLKYKPQFNLKTEFISGDKKYDDNKLNTFNPLFPRGAYFGYAAIIGPANLQDIHPSISAAVSKKLNVSVDYDAFWRYSSNDGIYGPSTALIFSGKSNDHKFIGNQCSVFFIYEPGNFLYFRGEFTWFKAGDFLEAAGAGNDILFTGLTAQFKF